MPVAAALALIYGPTSTPWKYSPANRKLAGRALRARAGGSGCSAVITTADETFAAGVPTFVYQDMNFAVAEEQSAEIEPRLMTMAPTAPNRIRRLVEEQQEEYAGLAGVLAFSHWFRGELIEQGVPSQRVDVVGAGLTSVSSAARRPADAGERTRLLFVGREFERKGGDHAVAAVELLRREGDLPLTLTVAGPRRWPLPGDPPPWVRFLGPASPSGIGRLLSEHDLFVMPSRFEAYGIALLEAQAAGLPCIARQAFAMPELVPVGRGGHLVEREGGAEEVAAAIATALGDDALFDAITVRAGEVRREHTWDAVAKRSVAAIGRRLESKYPG